MPQPDSTTLKTTTGFGYEFFAPRKTKEGWETGIEVTRHGDHIDEVGLWFNADKELEDFDGVFALDKHMIKVIRKAGFIVTKGMEELCTE